MKKVCHMTSVHNQTDIRIFEKECVSLAEHGYEVHLIAPGEDGNKKNIQIHGIGKTPKKRWKRMIFSTRKVGKISKKIDADIYHFHDPELIPLGLKLVKNGKKVIFDSHENVLDQFIEKEYIPLIVRKILNTFFVSYIKYVCEKFTAIISVDPSICKNYKKYNPQTIMVANYPEIEEIHKKSTSKNYICFAGGISKQWNHDIVIQAIHNLEDISYVLCGNADEDYLSYLRTLPGWEKVDYRGKVSHGEALELLSGAVAGVALASYSRNTNGKEGTLGNTKLFEIMMCGIPVICTDFNTWKNIIEKKESGYCIRYDDIDELKKIIQKLIKQPEMRKKIGDNGRKCVEKNYNWDNEKKQLLSLYLRL